MEDDRLNLTLERERFGMEYFSIFGMAYGMESDGSDIIGKGSLKEVETREVVPVGRFHVKN